MDVHLKLLAEAGLALIEAEEAAGHGELGQAAEALDRAEVAIADLRTAWGGMTAAQRSVVGPAATQLRDRLERTRAALPPRRALSVGARERDPDEEVDPEPAG